MLNESHLERGREAEEVGRSLKERAVPPIEISQEGSRYLARMELRLAGTRTEAARTRRRPAAGVDSAHGTRTPLALASILYPGQTLRIVQTLDDEEHLRCHLILESRRRTRQDVLQSLHLTWQNFALFSANKDWPYRLEPAESHSGYQPLRRVRIEPRAIYLRMAGGIGFVTRAGAIDGGAVALPYPVHTLAPTHIGALGDLVGVNRGEINVQLSYKCISLSPDSRRRLEHVYHHQRKHPQAYRSPDRSDPLSSPELFDNLFHTLDAMRRSSTLWEIECNVDTDAEEIPSLLLRSLGEQIFSGRPTHIQTLSDPSRDEAPNPSDDDTILDLHGCFPPGYPQPTPFPEPSKLIRLGVARTFPPLESRLPREGIGLGTTLTAHGERVVRYAPRDRTRHCYILGATGTGKSMLLYNMIIQDIHNGEGVCLLDPHGDLYRQVLEAVPDERLDDLVLINTGDAERAVGINFLECDPYEPVQVNFIINELLRIFERLYNMDIAGGPVFEQYMRNALTVIMDNEIAGGMLMDLTMFFANPTYRNRLLDRCRNPYAIEFWRGIAMRASGEAAFDNFGPYVTSKVDQFTNNALLRPIINQSKSTIDLPRFLDQRKIVLVNLAKGLLGEINTRLLGMILISKFYAAALGRTEPAAGRRHPFYLYIDEAQNFATDTVGHILAEARKFGLHMIMANQTLSQMIGDPSQGSLIDAILGNVGSLLTMRLGIRDANLIESYLEPEFTSRDVQGLEDRHVIARLLIHGMPSRPFVFRTMDVEMPETPDPKKAQERAELIDLIRQMYSRTTTEVESEIKARYDRVLPAAVRDLLTTD